jgi:hypothetical protein
MESAELKYKKVLEDFFITEYGNETLSSHGLDHHRRVWSYAKELLTFLASSDYKLDAHFHSQTIIACYNHDLGMSIDPGINHGLHSMELCKKFIRSMHLNEPDFKDALHAIRNHDNKEYKNPAIRYDLLTLLSVADDLDAFGFIGIYRYSEIYLIRNITLPEIGSLIIKNAEGRYRNFKKHFEFSEPLISKHYERFNILIDFFHQYNKQLSSHTFGKNQFSGHCGVLEILAAGVKARKPVRDIISETKISEKDPVVIWFFTGLERELSDR